VATVCDNVNALMSKSPGALLVRGWKVLLLDLQGVEKTMWQAIAHLVVLRNGALTDPTQERLGPYVFLPSTRLVPKINDSELLCGMWMLPSVVGGSRAFQDAMCIRHPRDLATSPEAVFPRKRQWMSLPRGVLDWAELRFPGRDVVSLLEAINVATPEDFDRPHDAPSTNTQFLADLKHVERTSATAEEAQERLVALLDDLHVRNS